MFLILLRYNTRIRAFGACTCSSVVTSRLVDGGAIPRKSVSLHTLISSQMLWSKTITEGWFIMIYPCLSIAMLLHCHVQKSCKNVAKGWSHRSGWPSQPSHRPWEIKDTPDRLVKCGGCKKCNSEIIRMGWIQKKTFSEPSKLLMNLLYQLFTVPTWSKCQTRQPTRFNDQLCGCSCHVAPRPILKPAFSKSFEYQSYSIIYRVLFSIWSIGEVPHPFWFLKETMRLQLTPQVLVTDSSAFSSHLCMPKLIAKRVCLLHLVYETNMNCNEPCCTHIRLQTGNEQNCMFKTCCPLGSQHSFFHALSIIQRMFSSLLVCAWLSGQLFFYGHYPL